jgi:hypothetical protein
MTSFRNLGRALLKKQCGLLIMLEEAGDERF